MEIISTTFGIIVVSVIIVCLGWAIASYISRNIDNNIRHKKFMKDMEKFDNKKIK